MHLPKPMVGFNLSNGLRSVNNRLLPGPAIEPPYFYYENVALAAKGVWGVKYQDSSLILIQNL